MTSALAFFRARWAERSTRIQMIVLVLLALVLAGVLTVDQITENASKLLGLIAVLGPLAGALMPDNNKAVDDAAARDAAIAAAVALATKAAEDAAGPGARELSRAVSDVVDAVEGRLGS